MMSVPIDRARLDRGRLHSVPRGTRVGRNLADPRRSQGSFARSPHTSTRHKPVGVSGAKLVRVRGQDFAKEVAPRHSANRLALDRCDHIVEEPIKVSHADGILRLTEGAVVFELLDALRDTGCNSVHRRPVVSDLAWVMPEETSERERVECNVTKLPDHVVLLELLDLAYQPERSV